MKSNGIDGVDKLLSAMKFNCQHNIDPAMTPKSSPLNADLCVLNKAVYHGEEDSPPQGNDLKLCIDDLAIPCLRPSKALAETEEARQTRKWRLKHRPLIVRQQSNEQVLTVAAMQPDPYPCSPATLYRIAKTPAPMPTIMTLFSQSPPTRSSEGEATAMPIFPLLVPNDNTGQGRSGIHPSRCLRLKLRPTRVKHHSALV